MKTTALMVLLMVLFYVPCMVTAGDTDDGATVRTYEFPVGHPADMNFVASCGITLDMLLTDAWYLGIGKNMRDPYKDILGTTWQVWWTFMITIWPHEFGHWVRAREIGGEFVFESFGIPWPKARMDLPENCDPISETLTSVGGFEINVLMRRAVMGRFYRDGFAFSDQLVLSVIQGIYFPSYAFIVAPLVAGGIDPTDPDTWINTMGDPVESAQGVFRSYWGKPSLVDGETVDPDLVAWYWEYTLLGLAWLLVDPSFYASLKAFGTDMKDEYGKVSAPMIGNDRFRWMAGTLFNPGPLGYELFLHSHLLADGRYFGLYLKYGRPYLNLGFGIDIPALLSAPAVKAGVRFDYWYEEPWGHGIRAGFNSEIDLSRKVSLGIDAGWKTRGYLIGYPLAEGMFVQGKIFLHGYRS